MATKEEMKQKLGKGMSAYFPSLSSHQQPVIDDKSTVVNEHSSEISNDSSVMSDERGVITVDKEVLTIAIAEAKKNPRVPLWSEVAKTLLLYNQLLRDKRLVRPKMSLSEEGSAILDNAVREAFPEMCELIEKELKKIG